jgi:asparagine synthase (glutamine-hydrolysing)
MCGISGFWVDPSASLVGNLSDLKNIAKKMSLAIRHRGPDDNGAWCDLNSRIFLSHQRLAIIDTSDGGHQPMISRSGRYIIIFNGEIYNYKNLRIELSNIAAHSNYIWKSDSDTEVLLAAIDFWGVSFAIKKLEGMFGAVIWDSEKKQLHLVRDRFGEKPIYYGWSSKNTFIFASDLAAFLQHDEFHPEIDQNVLALYLRFLYVPAPYSIYKGVYKLEPGSLLTLSDRSFESPPSSALFCPSELKGLSISRYWDSFDLMATQQDILKFKSESAVIDTVSNTLERSVIDQMTSDVNLGAFLSGGIDSSLVAAFMQKNSSSPINTFTIGFSESSYDEAAHAKDIALYLGTRHFEHYVSSKDIIESAQKVANIYSEPFADSSQLPTYILSKFARKNVTVALSGDGADELFGGYNRYIWGDNLYSFGRNCPEVVKQKITPFALDKIQNLTSFFGQLTPKKLRVNDLPNKARKALAQLENCQNVTNFYYGIISAWPLDKLPLTCYVNLPLPNDLIKDDKRMPNNFREIAMIYDTLMYLPDGVLQKVDRASMAVGLEVRSPFLNHKVAELAWQIPNSMKFKRREGKWILKEVLNKHIPKALYQKPKSGFTPPISIWLRGPLKEWADALLSPKLLAEDGLFIVEDVRSKWLSHLNGSQDWGNQLWSIVMFQSWKHELQNGK